MKQLHTPLNESKLSLKDLHARLICFPMPLKGGKEGWNKRNRLLKEEQGYMIGIEMGRNE
ncbi:hypothetical protein [Fluviicola taffensis]|uniref:hypothetical protein n=1 Tax=Fluviicola taffensis TaxID=191579 RepID=UPI0031381AAE